MRSQTLRGTAATLLLCAGGASAQDVVVTALLTEGDVLPGVGTLDRLDNLAATDRGTVFSEWLAAPGTVVLRDGELLLADGDPLAAPENASILNVGTLRPNDADALSVWFDYDGVSPVVGSGVHVNDVLIGQQGSNIPGLAPTTVWSDFVQTRLNDADQLLVAGEIDDPTNPILFEDLLVRFDLDADFGIVGTTVIAREGQPSPIGGTLLNIERGASELEMNDAGRVIWGGSADAPSDVDRFVAIDGLVVVREGDLSPVPGRTWSSLANPEVDINNNNEFVISGTLSGDSSSNALITLNGQKFVQEGDQPPGVPGFQLTSFGSGPVLLNDLGEVVWYGRWNGPSDSNEGLFLDQTLLLRSGDVLDGRVIDRIRGVGDGYSMSEDGSVILVEVLYEGNLDGLVRITRGGEVESFDGCVANVATLAADGAPSVGDVTGLTIGASPFASNVATVRFSTARLDPLGDGCGLTLPGIGELLLDPLSPNGQLPVVTFDGPTADVELSIPGTPAVLGLELFLQGLLLDGSGGALTNALRIRIGA